MLGIGEFDNKILIMGEHRMERGKKLISSR